MPETGLAPCFTDIVTFDPRVKRQPALLLAGGMDAHVAPTRTVGNAPLLTALNTSRSRLLSQPQRTKTSTLPAPEVKNENSQDYHTPPEEIEDALGDDPFVKMEPQGPPMLAKASVLNLVPSTTAIRKRAMKDCPFLDTCLPLWPQKGAGCPKHESWCDRKLWCDRGLPDEVPEGYLSKMRGAARTAGRLNQRYVGGKWRAEVDVNWGEGSSKRPCP